MESSKDDTLDECDFYAVGFFDEDGVEITEEIWRDLPQEE